MRREVIVTAISLAVAACAEERARDGEVPDCPTCIHPPGVLDPESEDFHGDAIAERGWDLRRCMECHGEDFSGGVAGATCLGCHDEPEGPAACDTCHPAVPMTAAHPVHVAQWPCATCHEVPARWDDPGHVLFDPRPAEARGFDPRTFRCSVSCHGAARPAWDGGPDEAPCGSCHGAPPPDHAWDRCATCHPTGEAHADGVLQVGRTAGCDGCHGGGGEAAPPIDLHGNTFTGAPGVGAHRSHLDGPHRIAGTITCAACHRVPATLFEAGHIDTPPPVELVLAVGWEADAGTCANACHGMARPRWTAVGEGEIACGTCHGVPPAAPPHAATMTLGDCAGCHAATVNGFGGILVSGPPGARVSEHIDGEADVD